MFRFLLCALAALASAALPCASQSADPYRVYPTAPRFLRQTLDSLAAAQFAERARAVASIRAPEDVKARGEQLRQFMLGAFDGWPERTPLHAKIVGSVEREGYRIEKLVYESLPGFFVTANVYVPTSGPGPFPAVLGTAGHAEEGKGAGVYQMVWISLAKRGFIVLAYDPIGQGERSQYLDIETGEKIPGSGSGDHIMAGGVALLTGTHLARYLIWDGIRGLDYLLTRGDVDPKRIAAIGNSGGGTQSAYLNALESRLATAVPSCYITSWPHLWKDRWPQDSEQVFVDFLKNGFDFADFLTAQAPRPVKMLTAMQDYFPIAGAREAFAETQRSYRILGAEDRAGFFTNDDKHGWSKPRREATYAWLEKWLYGRDVSAPEPPIKPETSPNKSETPEALRVTASGQVLLSLGGRSIQRILRERAEEQFAAREALRIPDEDRPAFQSMLRRTMRMLPRTADLSAPRARIERTPVAERTGYRVEKLALPVDDAIAIPALLFAPARKPSGSRRIVLLDDRGKAAEAGESGLLGSLAQSGHTVLALDVRGIGELGIAARLVGNSPIYQESMRALLVGTSLPAIQTGDLLAALDCAQHLEGWGDGPVTILGKGNMGWIALFGAVLDQRIEGIAAEESLLSYMDIARSPRNVYTIDLVLPGVLRRFDMPDLVAHLNDRRILLLNARSPMDFLHARETVTQAYAPAAIAFQRAARPEAFQIRKESEDQRNKVYREWLR